MSEQVTVDSLEFARGAKSLQGSFEIASLDRLHDRLASLAGTLVYQLSGFVDGKGRPGLRCRVQGTLELVCQRCLKPMTWEADLRSELLLAASEAELAGAEDEPEAPDWLLAEKEMDVRALVEDEVLLGLPIAPKHPEGRCRAALPPQDAAAASPFAALARLKTSGIDQPLVKE